MQYLEYLVTGLAIFFAGGWALGLVVSPSQRIGSTILTVIFWWIALTAWFFGSFSALHLLWVFPLALFLPAALLLRSRQP